MSKINYSVVVPVYNGENTVEELADRLRKMFEKINKTYEIIFIDDYSRDGSWLKLEQLAEIDDRIKIIKLTRNFGQQNATLCGMSFSKGEFIVTMDDDLQHNPEDIPKLIQKRDEEGSKVVIAKLIEKKHSWYRRKASDFNRWMNEILLGKPKGLYLSSFRLIERQTAENILNIKTAFPYFSALLFYVTRDVSNVEVAHNKRKYGRSNYTLSKMFKLFSQLLINNSSVLLRISARTGLIVLIIGMILLINQAGKYIFFHKEISTLTVLMSFLIFLSGAHLFFLGVVGEYLIRLMDEVIKKPAYIVEKTKNIQE